MFERSHLGHLSLCIDKDAETMRSELIVASDLVVAPEQIALEYAVRNFNALRPGSIDEIFVKLPITDEEIHVELKGLVLLNALVDVFVNLLDLNLYLPYLQ